MMLLSLLANRGGGGTAENFLHLLPALTVAATLHIVAEITLSPLKTLVFPRGEGAVIYNMLLLGISLAALTASR